MTKYIYQNKKKIMPTSKKKNNLAIPTVAIVGSGYWGKNLVRNFHSLKALRLICDNNETLLKEFQKQYDGVEVCLND